MWRSALYVFLSLPVFALLYLHTTVIVFLSIPCAISGQKSCIRKLIHFWAKTVFWIMAKKIEIHGLRYINKNKKYILLVNHTSLFDIMAVMSVFPGVSWFGKEYLQKIPLFGYILKMINYIPMKTSDLNNTRDMLNRLIQNSKNMTIAIFPEGTRTINGKLNRFHKGFLYVLKATELSILPVTLNGFFNLKPKTRFHINFSSRLQIVIHNPIEYESIKFKNDLDIIAQVKDVIESALSY